MKKFIIALILVFFLGWLSNNVYSGFSFNKEFPFVGAGVERSSPQDVIDKKDITIEKDRVIISLKDASLAAYADTNSMDPLFDKGANGIEIKPKCDALKPGDIIAYQSRITNDLIVHRILDIREDNQGRFFRMKGDNNAKVDPEKVICDQVRYQLVGILY